MASVLIVLNYMEWIPVMIMINQGSIICLSCGKMLVADGLNNLIRYCNFCIVKNGILKN